MNRVNEIRFWILCVLYSVCPTEAETFFSEDLSIKPKAWSTKEDVRYVVHDKKAVTFRQARRLCDKNGQRLVIVTNAKEDMLLEETVGEYNMCEVAEGFWLGISDAVNEGVWTSVYSNKPITYSIWDIGRPTNQDSRGNKDCAVVTYREIAYEGTKGVWSDVPCNSKRKVICEIKTPSSVPYTSKQLLTTEPHRVFNLTTSTQMNAETTLIQQTTTTYLTPTTNLPMSLEQVEDKLRNQTGFESKFVEEITNEIEELSRDSTKMTDISTIRRIVSVLTTISPIDQIVTPKSLMNVVQVANVIHDRSMVDNVSQASKTGLVRALSSFATNVALPRNERSLVTASRNVAIQVTKVRTGDKKIEYNSSMIANTSAADSVLIRLPVRYVSSNQSTSDFRVSFISYEDDVFFPSEYRVEKVVSAVVSGSDVSHLLQITPLQYITPLLGANSSNEYRFLSCSFWDFNLSSWSSEGCSLVVGSVPPQCECSHLSNFALIVRLYYIPPDLGLDLIGKIGCSLSVIGFFLTSYIYIHFGKLRNSKPGPIHIHLCMCLGVAYLVFLIGSDQIYEGTVCIVVAAGMHYFLLAAWLWMFIEGIAMYRNLVVKFGAVGDKFILKSAVACYTIPAITVAVTLGITVGFFDNQTFWYSDPDNEAIVDSTYVHQSFCWLHDYTLIAAFLGEIGIIFIVNCVIYGAVVRSITWGRRRVHSTKAKEGSREHVIKATAVSALLGLTWIFSLPLFLSSHPLLISVFSYIFSILNSLQGVVIFYLFCVRNRSTRNLWWKPIKRLSQCFRPKRVTIYEVTQI